jgi:hypothetical protein
MSNQISLDDLLRNLREVAAVGDEQLQGTMRSGVNFLVMVANNAQSRSKPRVTVNQKSTGAAVEGDPELEYADLNITRRAATLESESEPERNWREEELPTSTRNEEELTNPIIEEELPTSTRNEEELSQQKSSSETLYKFSNFLNAGASFKQGITGVEAQAILDLISGSEGSKISNGENLLITSGGKKLFETDAEGTITYSANDRDRRFKANRNIPIVNSINDLQQRATSVVRNEQLLRDELEVSQTTGQEQLDRTYERMTKASSVARSSPETPDAQAIKEKVDALRQLKDTLDREGKVKLDNGTTIKAEPIPGRQSEGIVQIKMYEVDAPEPVVLGKVDEKGNIFLEKEYTAPRYTALKQFIKNQELANQAPGKAPIAAPTAVVNNQPDAVPDVPPGVSPTLSSNNGGVKAPDIPPGQSPTAPSKGVSIKQLIDLKNYYLKSPDGREQPQSVNAEANFKRYKSQISKDGKAVTGNKDLRMTNEFFDGFKSEAVTLSPEDKANLEAANQFAVAQERAAQEMKEQSKPPTKQRSQSKSVAM